MPALFRPRLALAGLDPETHLHVILTSTIGPSFHSSLYSIAVEALSTCIVMEGRDANAPQLATKSEGNPAHVWGWAERGRLRIGSGGSHICQEYVLIVMSSIALKM